MGKKRYTPEQIIGKVQQKRWASRKGGLGPGTDVSPSLPYPGVC
jgi:hypothetical protein